jgi:hypothetical protein
MRNAARTTRRPPRSEEKAAMDMAETAANAGALQNVVAKASEPSILGRLITAGVVIAVLASLSAVYILSDDVKNLSSKQRGGRRLPTQTLIMLAIILCLPMVSIVWTSNSFLWPLFYLLFLVSTLTVFHDTPLMLQKTGLFDGIHVSVLIVLNFLSWFAGAGFTHMFCALVVFSVELIIRWQISVPWPWSSPPTPPTPPST